MKVFIILVVALLLVDLANSASCSAPHPFILNDSGPFGYTCDDKLIMITALGLEAVQFPATGTVIVKKDLSYSCCNSNGGCSSTTWTIPAPYRIASTNFLKADGYCAQAGVADGVGPNINANTPDCQVDNSAITSVCGTRTWCGCEATSCSVTPLGRDLAGTITISGWGDCTTSTIYGPLTAYTQTVALNYDCFAPYPFVKGGAGAYGYTCNSTGSVILTGLGNVAAISFNTAAKTVVVEKKFQYSCCNSHATCEGAGRYAEWVLPSGFAVSTSNYLKADGYCAQATVDDGNGAIGAPTSNCMADNANVAALCGARENCGCVFTSCSVVPISRSLVGSVKIYGWGDCTTTSLYGPGKNSPNSIVLSYGN